MSKNRRPKLSWRERSEVNNIDLSVTYDCPETKKTVTVKIPSGNMVIEGGCDGNHGPGDYCYCPPTKVIFEWDDCPECKGKHKTRME